MNTFTPQQSEAITARGNVLVVAGAGTGKTHTLISRCLRLVTEERVSIENILMVTFTEAAAAEMRARLRSGLQTLHLENPEDEYLAQQLALLDTARISTLHGFCLQLLREHFHALGLDPQFSVLDEQQTRPLQREALDEILERHYLAPADTDPVQKLIRVLGRGSDEAIRKLVVTLHSFTRSLARPEVWMRQQELCFAKKQPDKWRNGFIEAVVTLRAEWLAEIRQHRGTAAVDISIEALEKLSKQPIFAQAADAVRLIYTADKDKKKNWPRGSIGKVRDLIKAFFEEVEFLAALAPVEKQDPLSEDWNWCREQMLALLALVCEFGAVFAGKKRELGGVDFSDMEQSSLKMLFGDDGAVTPVALEWQGRLTHVVVDEYQDINAAQDAILAALSRTSVDANRFLVGDAKQSIYRFRLANPGIFQAYHRAWSDGNAGRSLSLTQNFRSRPAILNFVNGLFGSLMCEEIGGVNYESLQFGDESSRIALSKKPSDSKCVELHIIAKSDEDADEAEGEVEDSRTAAPDLPGVEREARLVARRLRELKEGKHQVWDKNANCFRDVKWSDMAVLLRSPNGRAEAFAMEFNRAGIPLSAARDGFFSSLEVSDLLNLLKLLDNSLQDVPLVAVLRSPLVGLTLEELARIRAGAGAGRELFWTSLLKWRDVMRDAWCVNEQLETRAIPHAPRTTHHTLLTKIDTFVESIHRWRELVRQTSLSQTLETALVETHYESLLLAGERGVERAANVRRLLDLARQFDPYQRQGLHRFLKFIRLQEHEELDLQPATAPTDDAVRLMSVHKSKGLEFPVVVLASTGTYFNEQDLGGAVLFNQQYGLCPRITPPGSAESYPGLTHWMARRTEKRELRGEELRLLYVATTRARDHLILVGTANSKAADVCWPVAMDLRLSTNEVLSARSHMGWLIRWLPGVTSPGDWKEDRAGENDLLRWKIYDESDLIFANPDAGDSPTADSMAEPMPGADEIESLKSRLNWSYSFQETTERAAKTSVSVLRRQADEEAEQMFQVPSSKFQVELARRDTSGLSAAEVGTAHHTFLEHFNMGGEVEKSGLQAEAERLKALGVLTIEQSNALDFAALARFWNSDVGQLIRLRATSVKRELEFTARFGTGELDQLVRPEEEIEAARLAGDDFVVVQGVADLVVILDEEIWLLDFKTDQISGDGVRDKVGRYSVQLRLYALALSRIHRRPVKKCWLHFLSVGKTEAVDVS